MENYCYIIIYVLILVVMPIPFFTANSIKGSNCERFWIAFSSILAIGIIWFDGFLLAFNDFNDKIQTLQKKAVLIKLLDGFNSEYVNCGIVIIVAMVLLYVTALPYCEYMKNFKKALQKENNQLEKQEKIL